MAIFLMAQRRHPAWDRQRSTTLEVSSAPIPNLCLLTKSLTVFERKQAFRNFVNRQLALFLEKKKKQETRLSSLVTGNRLI